MQSFVGIWWGGLVPGPPPRIPKSEYAQVPYIQWYTICMSYPHTSVYFKSSPDYLLYLIWYKCYGNSCWYSKFKVFFLEISGNLIFGIFLSLSWLNLWMCNPDMEDWLYSTAFLPITQNIHNSNVAWRKKKS